MKLDFDGDVLQLEKIYKAKARVSVEGTTVHFENLGECISVTAITNGIKLRGLALSSEWNRLPKEEIDMNIIFFPTHNIEFYPTEYSRPNGYMAVFLCAESIEEGKIITTKTF